MGLSVKNIQLNYGKKEIIRDVSFEVKAGEIVALFGPSGSGKTSLLKMIAGIQPVSKGKIAFTEDFTQDKTLLVFQDFWLFPHMTVVENISFGLKVRKFAKDKIAEKVEKIIEVFDLTGLEKHYPDQLSGGQKQRVALARAVVLEPKLLLLDEPFANLDQQLKITMREYLRRLQETYQFSIILVTHDRDEAFQLADRMVILLKGEIHQIDEAKEIYYHPAGRLVAEAIGETNLIRGVVQKDIFRAENVELRVHNPRNIQGESLLFIPIGMETSIQNSGVLAFVKRSEWTPNGQQVLLEIGNTECTLTNLSEKVTVGEEVYLTFSETLTVMRT